MHAAPPIADQIASARASAAAPGRRGQALDDRQRDVPEQHVDGIAGRMRLVQRRVEMAQPEREVDRIDVFERRREEWDDAPRDRARR